MDVPDRRAGKNDAVLGFVIGSLFKCAIEDLLDAIPILTMNRLLERFSCRRRNGPFKPEDAQKLL